MLPHILPASFMISIVSRDAFGGFTFATFSAKKYSSSRSCNDQPIFDRVFNVFFFNLNCSLIYRVCSSLYLRRTVSLQWFYRLFLDLFFIQSLRGSLFIGEMCTSTYGYNYTNTLYIDITIPSDNTSSRDDGTGYNIGSITACIAGIPATTFCYLI